MKKYYFAVYLSCKSNYELDAVFSDYADYVDYISQFPTVISHKVLKVELSQLKDILDEKEIRTLAEYPIHKD